MEALQPPHPLDKKTMASDMAHISSLPPPMMPSPLSPLSCCCFLFYSSFFLCLFVMHGFIKGPFVPFQCCGHKSYRDLFDSLSSD